MFAPSLDIHAALAESYDLLIPLLMRLNSLRSLIHLHVYEGEIAELVAASALEKIPVNLFNKLVTGYGNTISMALNNNHNMPKDEWNIAAGYAWHKVLTTTYYLQENSSFKNSKKLPCGNVPAIDENKITDFLELFKIPNGIYSQLRKISSSSLLLLSTSPRFPSLKKQHQEALVDVIQHAINEFAISEEKILLFREKKEGEVDGEILRQLGCKAIKLPELITLNFLKVLEILPLAIAGYFSDELYQAPEKSILFFLTTELPEDTDKYAGHINFSNKKIYHVNELVGVKPGSFKKRVFYCPGSMGDAIYALGCLTAFRECHDEDFIFIAHKLYHDLIASSPVVAQYWDINALTEDAFIDIAIARQENKFHFLGHWEDIVASEHMTDAFIGDSIHNHSLCNKQPMISLASLDKKNVNDFIHNHYLQKEKTVLLHPNIGSPNRTWTEKGWNQLAKYFIAAGWKVVIIGSDNNKYQEKKMMDIDIPEAINCINQFSMLEMIYLMERCQLLVACDSGPVALAGLTSIAICALYSIIPASYRLPYRNGRYGWNAMGIDTECQFGQCGHLIMSPQFVKNKLGKEFTRPRGDEFSVWCPNDKKYRCMKKVTAEYFWHQIQLFLSSDDYVKNS
ncbi:glycosyltransferase family 9 protein [Citrobacter braakii]